MRTKLFLITLISSLSLCSCAKTPAIMVKYDMEWTLDALFQSYHNIYFEVPQSADDLINYVKLIEQEEGALKETNEFYRPYLFLKKYRNKIVISADNEHIYMYLKNLKPHNLIAATEYYSFCNNERGLYGHVRFFDDRGVPIIGEVLNEQYNKELKRKLFESTLYKSPNAKWQKKEGAIFEDVVILEYTPDNGLINICSHNKIDLDSSKYYQDLNGLIGDFCKEYDLSRIVLDSYVSQ